MGWKARVTKLSGWWMICWFHADGSPGLIFRFNASHEWHDAIRQALAGPPDTLGWAEYRI